MRELELAKEKLCRLGVRAEYYFHSKLQAHPDRAWAHIYRNEGMRPKSELKRVRTFPAVVTKAPTGGGRGGGGGGYDLVEDDACSACEVCTKYNTMKSSKPAVTRRTTAGGEEETTRRNNNRASQFSFSQGDDAFPPPPPLPLLLDSECLTTTTSEEDPLKKRLSDRWVCNSLILQLTFHFTLI